MLNLDLYIHGCGLIAPEAAASVPALKLTASEPDYSSWIPPMQLRRMSKVVRMGIGAAKACMTGADIEQPDALSVGTAFGCLQDTEHFLSKMISQEERMLTPTAFIQSTHNTVGGQIALLAGCYGHNMTYVHRGHSFEHAVINTRLYLEDRPGERVLTGGIDELTVTSHQLMQQAGVYCREPVAPADMAVQETTGSVAGEGAGFFLLSRDPAGAQLRIRGIALFTADGPDAAMTALPDLPETEPGLLLTGRNGDGNSAFYDRLQDRFPDAVHAAFKPYCGEYPTAAAAGLAQALRAAQTGLLPDGTPVPALRRILLVNHYCDHYSCWLLETV